MRGLKELTWINLKLYIREPIGTFFTLAFPPLLIVLFGAIYGNDPSPMFGGHGSMDVSMSGYTAIILSTVGFMNIPITIGNYRELGVLRRYQASALRPRVFITADVIANMLMLLLGLVLLVSTGWLLHDVRFEGNVLSFVLGVICSGLAMFAFGYLIASLAPGARAAQVIGMVFFYPMMFLSGAAIPLEIMPDSIQHVADFLPLTYVVNLLRGLWFGDGWGQHLTAVLVLVGVFVVSAVAAVRIFRWE
jgi:ABC-2 type transport system permease protein